MTASTPGGLADELRAAFDETFAEKVVAAESACEELLAIRAHDRQLALRTNEITGILRCPALTALPSRNPALCGLAGVRGVLVGVYDVAALLNARRVPPVNPWIVLCAGDRSLALLFDELVGYARVDTREILRAEQSQDVSNPANELVQLDGIHRMVLSIPDLLDAVKRIAEFGSKKE